LVWLIRVPTEDDGSRPKKLRRPTVNLTRVESTLMKVYENKAF